MGFLNESSKRTRRFLEISLKRLKYNPNGDLSTLSSNGDHISSTTGVLINDLTISSVSDNGDLTTISSVSDNDYDLTSCIEVPNGDLTISSVSPNDNLAISSVIPNGDLKSSSGDSSDDLFKDIDEFFKKNKNDISSILNGSNFMETILDDSSELLTSEHNSGNIGRSLLSSTISNLHLDNKNIIEEFTVPNPTGDVEEKSYYNEENSVSGKGDNIVSSEVRIECYVPDDEYGLLLDELLSSVSPDDQTDKVSITNEIPDEFLSSQPSESHRKEECSLTEAGRDDQPRELSFNTRIDSSSESLLDILNNRYYVTSNVHDEAVAVVRDPNITAQTHQIKRSKEELSQTEGKHMIQPNGLSLCARIDSSNESPPEPFIYSRCIISDVLSGNALEVTETDSQSRTPLIGLNKEEYLLKEGDNEIQTSVLSSHARIDSSSESLPDPGNNSPIVTSDVHIKASSQKSELGKGLIFPQIEQSKEYALIESEHEPRPSGLSSHAWIDSSCESLPDPENISHIVTSDAVDVAAKAKSQTDNSLLIIPQIELRSSEDELGESFDHMANRKIFKLVTKRKGVDVHQFEADDVTYSLKFPRLEEDVERSSDGEVELEKDVSKQNNSDDLETDVPEKINPEVLARSRAETKAQLLRAKREEREMLREYGRSAPYRRSRRGSKMMSYNRDINDMDSSDEDMEESSPLPKIHKPYSHYKRFIMVHRESKVYEQNILNKLMSRKWTSSCDNPGSTTNISLKDPGNNDTSDHGNLDSDEQDCPPSPKSSKPPFKAPSSTEAVNMPVFDW